MTVSAVILKSVVDARVSVHPMSANRVEVRVSGDLPIVWPERFATALAPRSIVIRQGEAERTDGRWVGRFELESTQARTDLNSVNFGEIFNTLPPTRQPRAIALLHYGLVRLKDALRLAIQAQDRNGLLADVLFKLKQLGLYSKRITIDSDAHLITQCFWLTSFGEREPDAQAERFLRELLSAARRLRPT